jgi:hypothetical protein
MSTFDGASDRRETINGSNVSAGDLGARSDLETLLVSAIGSVVEPVSAVYCSAPITTGLRFVRWFEQLPNHSDLNDPTVKTEFAAKVVTPNCQSAQVFANKLRVKLNSPVIDPSRVPAIDGWGQDKWLPFWARVIRTYAHTVAFIDNWEYSAGCVYEFYIATESGRATIDERGNVLTLDGALAMIRLAAKTIDERGAPVDSHNRTLERLLRLGHSESKA